MLESNRHGIQCKLERILCSTSLILVHFTMLLNPPNCEICANRSLIISAHFQSIFLRFCPLIFPSGTFPPTNNLYDVTAVLYWTEWGLFTNCSIPSIGIYSMICRSFGFDALPCTERVLSLAVVVHRHCPWLIMIAIDNTKNCALFIYNVTLRVHSISFICVNFTCYGRVSDVRSSIRKIQQSALRFWSIH